MKLIKPSAGLIAEFKAVQEQLREAQPRKMFGYDALFVNGNMAVGLWQNTCVLKLSEAEQKKLLSAGNATPFMPMPGRPMTGWVELSEELANDPEELLEWSRRAVTFVATLPPKAARGQKTGRCSGPGAWPTRHAPRLKAKGTSRQTARKRQTAKASTKPKGLSRPGAGAPAQPKTPARPKTRTPPKTPGRPKTPARSAKK